MEITIEQVKQDFETACSLLAETKELEKLSFSTENFNKAQNTRKMAIEAGNKAAKTAKTFGMSLETKKMPAKVAAELGYKLQIIEIGKSAFVYKI